MPLQVKREVLSKQPLGLPPPQQEAQLSTILEEVAPGSRKVAGLPALQSLSAYGPIQTSDLPDNAEALAIFGNRLNQKLHQSSEGSSLLSSLIDASPGDLLTLLFLVKDPPTALRELQQTGKSFMVKTAPGVCTDCSHFLAEVTVSHNTQGNQSHPGQETISGTCTCT